MKYRNKTKEKQTHCIRTTKRNATCILRVLLLNVYNQKRVMRSTFAFFGVVFADGSGLTDGGMGAEMGI